MSTSDGSVLESTETKQDLPSEASGTVKVPENLVGTEPPGKDPVHKLVSKQDTPNEASGTVNVPEHPIGKEPPGKETTGKDAEKDPMHKMMSKVDIPCCSICLDETKKETVRTVCTCHRLVHLSCLEKWLEASRSNQCEICKQKFQIRIEKRYSKPISVIVWLTTVCSKKTLLSDLVQFFSIGFLIALGIFIIIKSFNERQNVDITSRLISAFGASVMVLIIGTAYGICCYVAFKQYRMTWYNWYLRCNKVTIVFTPSDSHCMNLNSTGGTCCVPVAESAAGGLYCAPRLSGGQTDFTTMCIFSL
ncbi:hypothetical protein M8J76_009658 [Diaphorina citri]|nr:hypothetical protein M8J76_009658 [Diaphorina citri]